MRVRTLKSFMLSFDAISSRNRPVKTARAYASVEELSNDVGRLLT